MILPSSQKSSVIKPSQPKMAAVGDPHGGEIPMVLNAKPSDVFLCRRVSRINSDNRITLNLRLSKRLILIRRSFVKKQSIALYTFILNEI